MLLTSLKLKDFRQFKGEQTIAFATDKQKNVTIILGENGSGKTSLAQAFTWCLYGKTDFEDPILLCKSTSQAMLPGQEESVFAELKLTHSGTEYTITSMQCYKKNNKGTQSVGQRKFTIAFKSKDGQQEFIPDLQSELRMKEILPNELSKYFFFDGERIGNMSKELRKGRSREFANAVRSLLGLSAFTSAISHLKGRGTSKSVIRSYDGKYDTTSDKRIAEYTKNIDELNSDIEKIDDRLSKMEGEEEFVSEKISNLNDSIKENESSQKLAERKAKLINRRTILINRLNTQTSDLLKNFNKNAPAYFAKKLMCDSLGLLTNNGDNLDKGIPDIHARTIDHIIKVGCCICETEVIIGNDAFNALNRLRDYIPPMSLGQLIGSFQSNCENSVKNTESFNNDFCKKYSEIRLFETDEIENEEEIKDIIKRLEGMQDVGLLQAELTKYDKQYNDLKSERSSLDQSKGNKESNRERIDSTRHELTLKDKNNKSIEIYKAYAQYLYDYLSEDYIKEETRVRDELNKVIDKIFRTIYNGGFSLSLDENYNVQVIVNDHAGYNEDIETSTAQSISIIFAFIAGVIQMARTSQQPENAMLVSEPYPLVMDAPLSAFDTKRIQTVCTVLPKVAEQVIIFIKDTDGDIAEKHLKEHIGSRAIFDKKNEFETYIMGRAK